MTILSLRNSLVDQPGERGVEGGIEGWDGGTLIFKDEDIGREGGWGLIRWVLKGMVGLAVVVWNMSWLEYVDGYVLLDESRDEVLMDENDLRIEGESG